MRGCVVAGIAVLLALAGAVPAAAGTVDTMSVTGAVADPAGYTAAQLTALPQTTYPVRGKKISGVALENVVNTAGPVLPAGKNTLLRVLVTVTARHHVPVTFALGELDPSFGNHPAVLTTHRTEIDLVVPGDRTAQRTVDDVTGLRVAVSAATAATPQAGSVVVLTPRRTVTLSASRIAHLPSRTLKVTFLAGTASQTHTETGPPLSLVLLAAGVLPYPSTPVVTVGSDNYGAAVTPAEAYVGGRPLLLSTVEDGTALAQPRLVTDGDVKGGRYVSDVVVIDVRPPSAGRAPKA